MTTQPPANALPALVDEALAAVTLLRCLAILAPDREPMVIAAADALAYRAHALDGCSAVRLAEPAPVLVATEREG